MVKLELSEFDLIRRGSSYDRLIIYDGENSTARRIGSYYNSRRPPQIIKVVIKLRVYYTAYRFIINSRTFPNSPHSLVVELSSYLL